MTLLVLLFAIKLVARLNKKDCMNIRNLLEDEKTIERNYAGI